jgi:hypothetical protein
MENVSLALEANIILLEMEGLLARLALITVKLASQILPAEHVLLTLIIAVDYVSLALKAIIILLETEGLLA